MAQYYRALARVYLRQCARTLLKTDIMLDVQLVTIWSLFMYIYGYLCERASDRLMTQSSARMSMLNWVRSYTKTYLDVSSDIGECIVITVIGIDIKWNKNSTIAQLSLCWGSREAKRHKIDWGKPGGKSV